jgi:nitroimidazol reductase NimA-like FMN-containing flavoprotein (pyridoxamine 5'-phosphate oxidase superfamily)
MNMLGELTAEETEHLLLRGTLGRIGCTAEGRIYVVPINYAYDGESVIGHSADGLKIRTMRANPRVCFEVEDIADPGHWSCVVAQGVFEELSGADQERADTLLRSRLGAEELSEAALRHPRVHGVAQPVSRTTRFRIRLTEKSGRFAR